MSAINQYNNTILTNEFNSDSSLVYTGLLAMAMFGLSILTIVGNTVVIYALQTDRHLRTVGNLFILSLATADLIVGCFVMPIAGIYAIREKWNMGLVLCQIWLSVDYTASTASIFNLLTLSLDRYWSITSPLQYLGKRTRARALLLIGFAWGLSLLWVIPIFGWNRFAHNATINIDPTKCEPGFMHSKSFKVPTAIINFYFPLLVLICLNGRIYYEIKRRYKNVLLQRHSNKINESPSNHKLNPTRKNSRTPVTMTMCDSDRQLCSATINFTENDSLIMSKLSSIKTNEKKSKLRINFKDKKNRPIQITNSQKLPLKHTYSFVQKNHYAEDELTWFAHHEHSRASLSPIPTLRPHRAGSKHRLNVDERCYKHTHDCHSCRIYSNEHIDISHNRPHDSYHYYRPPQLPSTRSVSRTTLDCRRCLLLDAMRTTSATTTTMNIFNLCHCCSAATSAITIHSNLEPYDNTRKVSSSSSLSSSISRKQHTMSSYNLQRNSISSNIISRSNSCISRCPSNKSKQSTVWNQQEKAFRQLFAIVFGFTCCFLPYFILYMVVAFCETCVSERIITATVWLGYVNSTINPFLYALSNKHFRRTFNRILKRDQRRQSYYN